MADDQERLVVAIEARIAEFEKRMKQAERTGTQSYQGLRRGSKTATQQMEQDIIRSTTRVNQALAQTATRIGEFGRAFVGGLAVGVAVGALEGIRQAAIESTKSILEMSDQAKMAGVSFKAFQQLKFVAERNRIGVDALTDGLKELNLRADEFVVTGKGSAAEAFQRLGYSAEELKEKLKEPDQLFLEIIGKLEKLDKAAQIRIADELFGGTGGEKFVQLISQGERGIREQIKAAEDLGLVMDENMVKKAEEVNQKFALIATTISTHVKGAIVDAVSAWTEFFDQFNEFKEQSRTTLENRQAAIGRQRMALEEERGRIRNGDGGFPYWNPKGPAAKGRIMEIERELARLKEEDEQITRERSRRYADIPTALEPITVPGGGGAPFTGKGMLDLIGHAEGTDKGRGYNETLGYGKFTGGDKNLVLMTLDEIDALQSQMLRDPANTHNSSALGRYQIVQKTLRGLRGKLGLTGEEYFSPELQDRLAKELLRQRGNDPAGLRNEWEGLRNVDDTTIRSAFDTSSLGMGGEDQGITARKEKFKEQANAYSEMLARAREFIAEQKMEGDALGMTSEAAARLRYEQQLLNEARQAGIDLSPTQIDSIRQLAAEMASAEEQTKRLATSQEDLKQRAAEFGAQAKSVVSGFISDMQRGVSASEALKNALRRIASMMLEGALNKLFGGGGTDGGGLIGNLVGGLLGSITKRERGGSVTAGTPYIVGEKRPELFVPNSSGRIIPRIPTAAPAARPQTRVEKPQLNVNVYGGSGDDHIRMLVRQGVQSAMYDQHEQMRRGGFGNMQAAYATDKG